MKNIGIIGLGLLGGSFGLALKEGDGSKTYEIAGHDIDTTNESVALELGLIDKVMSLSELIESSDLIVLASPVNAIEKQLPDVLDQISSKTAVIDFGSTKERIVKKVNNHSNRNSFIAMHPIAGTENSGPKAAFSGLLKGKMMIICDQAESHPVKLQQVVKLFESIPMKIEYMSSQAHDKHIAFVSHLSHISSFGLGSTVLEQEKSEKSIFIMAGSGFDSTVRLAKSSPDMWSPIFMQNRENISDALGAYIEKLSYFKKLLDEENEGELHQFMRDTNDIRRVLRNPEKD